MTVREEKRAIADRQRPISFTKEPFSLPVVLRPLSLTSPGFWETHNGTLDFTLYQRGYFPPLATHYREGANPLRWLLLGQPPTDTIYWMTTNLYSGASGKSISFAVVVELLLHREIADRPTVRVCVEAARPR